MVHSMVRSHRQDWEELGAVDPLWAINSDPAHKFNNWNLDDFLASGAKDVAGIIRWMDENGLPKHRDLALDFGCGVGRLTRALAQHFGRVYGVDIADSMVARAKEINRDKPNCEFLTNEHSSLPIFPNDTFDLIYSRWVLQHLPSRSSIRAHIGSFVRCLKPDGLLIFQLRTGLSLKARLQIGRRLYAACRVIGIGERFLYSRFGLNPIRMTTISEAEVTALLLVAGAKLVDLERYSVSSGPGCVFHVTK